MDRPHEEDYIMHIHDRCAYLRAPLVQQTGHLENKGPISRLSQTLMLGIAVLLPIISDCYKKSLNLHLCTQFMRPHNIAKVFSRCLILRMWQFFNSEGNSIDTPLGIDIVSCLFSDRTSYLSGVKYRSYILNWVRHNLQD